jgi:hypothetical protein
MRHYEVPREQAKMRVSAEKAASLSFKMLYVGVGVAVVGVAGFFLAFFYQNVLNAAGLPYRNVQAAAIATVFAGWVVFRLFAGSLGISTRGLTHGRLVSILKNQAEVPLDEVLILRRHIGIALLTLGDDWALYPAVLADDPTRSVPAVLVGPGGVFAIQPVNSDPKRPSFRDPSPLLLAGRAELERRLRTPVTPILAFSRSRKKYTSPHDVKTFTMAELLAYLDARPETLDKAARLDLERHLQSLTNLPAHTPSLVYSYKRAAAA